MLIVVAVAMDYLIGTDPRFEVKEGQSINQK
jgi:hypothetical protein